MNDDNKKELLKKLKALAERGTAGEKQNAQAMLKNLMKKYNITEEAISEDVIFKYTVTLKSKYERKLFHQVFHSIIGECEGRRSYIYKGALKKGYLECTAAEFIEFKAKFEFYKRHLQADINLLVNAFIQKNNIFPPPDKVKKERSDYELTEEDKKMLLLANVMETHTFVHAIEKNRE